MTAPLLSPAAGSKSYRPDIDGLRAIAILSVLLFHAGLPMFSGGFVGVDVFFVISGYLITGNILSDLREGKFSLGRFYERRVRRIFPALYLAVAVTLLGGLALFAATDRERLFESATWLSFFGSNFYFAANSGYFDAAADQNALLHTWSLAIEEQFYVVFPLLLAGLFAKRRAGAKWIVLAIAIASLAYSIYAVDRDARPAFFSTPARVWELMVGSLIAMGLCPPTNNATLAGAIATIGLGLILASLVLITPDTPFPGIAAIPACVGSAALIWAGSSSQTPVSRWLSAPPMVFVGLISYSLYLLHWPILVLARYWIEGELSPLQTALALSLAFAAAWFSWRFVEMPFRIHGRSGLSRRALLGAALGLMAALGLGSAAGAWVQSGNYSTAEKYMEAERSLALAEPCMIRDTKMFAEWPSSRCRIAGTGATIAIWGDSFAAHYFGALRTVAQKSDRPLILLAESSCPPIAALDVPNRPGCKDFNAGALALLQDAKPSIVILSANWMVYEKKKNLSEVFQDKFALLTTTIARLRASGIKVIVIGPSPVFPAPVPRMAGRSDSGAPSQAKANFSRKFDNYFRVLAEGGSIEYLPAFESFCNADAMCKFREGPELYFWDTGHLTKLGSEQVIAKLVETSRDFAPAAAPRAP